MYCRFSDLVPKLSLIDEVFTMDKVNCVIVSLDSIKVENVMNKLKASQSAIIYLKSSKGHFHFKI